MLKYTFNKMLKKGEDLKCPRLKYWISRNRARAGTPFTIQKIIIDQGIKKM
jgi:hypothetical protein